MLNKQGFTLIELLTTIIVIAIVSAITVPIITEVIESADKNNFSNSAYGIISAARNYYGSVMAEDPSKTLVTFTFPDGATELDYRGETPKSGQLSINSDGKTALAIKKQKWCAIKAMNEDKVRIIDYNAATCVIGN